MRAPCSQLPGRRERQRRLLPVYAAPRAPPSIDELRARFAFTPLLTDAAAARADCACQYRMRAFEECYYDSWYECYCDCYTEWRQVYECDKVGNKQYCQHGCDSGTGCAAACSRILRTCSSQSAGAHERRGMSRAGRATSPAFDQSAR